MPDYTLDEQIRCVEREITYRKYVYPNLCIRGKMTTGTMEKEIALMQAVLQSLRDYQDKQADNIFSFD